MTKSGFVAIIGRPNVGKSTLLNQWVGQKISIASPKPQTTRIPIWGIKTLGDVQIVYIDTPGMHSDRHQVAINRYMNRMANSVIHDADIIVLMIDATAWHNEDTLVLNQLQNIDLPVILLINKIDLLKDKAALLPFINRVKELYPFAHIIPLSALNDDHREMIEKEMIALLPLGPFLFPEDQITDKSIRFLAAEMIREKLIRLTEKELPYVTTVSIDDFKTDERNLLSISAIIWVERPGQKAIVIGKKGARLKQIGTEARRDIEKMVDQKVFLRLWVKVKEGWSTDEAILKSLGYE